MSSTHPFDRYASYTDVDVLKDYSNRPLRKSLRVNTLKAKVEQVTAWAEEKKWQMQPVPWCPEAFFIDREDRSVALGKDLLHLLGHTYMQEAASMLPVELLDPQPGEAILDMSAAPGSKTTQIAARLQGRGVVVANDVQEKRLWTLKTALHRLGVTNFIVTKKVGQWFGKHMTERFDRVLCDAPCTAQGTARKDSDALTFCSMENIGKMAKLQRELLEAAIAATKVGGRIVYSTCTLTPEENEDVIRSILERFEDRIEVVDPLSDQQGKFESLRQSIEDSKKVSESIGALPMPLIRLWPQTYDTEGFFCAVLKKTAPTRDKEWMDFVRFQEDEVPRSRTKEISNTLQQRYGTPFIQEGECLYQRNDLLLLATQDVMDFRLPVSDYSLGLPFAQRFDDGRIRLDHDIVTLRAGAATQNVFTLSDEQMGQLLDGKDTTCDPELQGDTLLLYKDRAVGVGLAREGKLKNRLPRWVVQKS